jgi:hypothetical protein
MIKTFSKQRSYSELRQIHMKFLLICGVGVLLWTNTTARQFIADGLYNAAEVVQPR